MCVCVCVNVSLCECVYMWACVHETVCMRMQARVREGVCTCANVCGRTRVLEVEEWETATCPLPFRSFLFPGTDHHCFQGDHNFATCNHAKFKNIKVPKKSFSTVYIYLMDSYILQLEAMNLKGNIEDLPKFVQMRLPHFYFMLSCSILPHFVFRKCGITHL